MSSRRANPFLIGAFLCSALAICVLGLLLLGGGRFFNKNVEFILYFSDSVNGLDIGAPVKFKGVQVGEVTDIRIQYAQPQDSDAIPIFISIDADRLRNRLGVKNIDLADPEDFNAQIELGLRGRMELVSYVTGKLFIELDYYPESTPAYFVQQTNALNGKQAYYREIPTVPNDLQALWESATLTLADISNINFGGIAAELETLVGGLAGAVSVIDFKTLNDNMIAATGSLNELVGSPEARASLNSLHTTLEDISSLTKKLDAQANPIAEDLRASVQELNALLSAGSPFRYRMDAGLEEIGGAARAVRELATYLQRNPSALVRGRPEEASQ